MTSKIENLDPEHRKATERLNRLFVEEHDNIESFTKEELLYHLSTVLLWYDLEIKWRREQS